MLTLPDSNPAASLVREALTRPCHHHKAGIHCTLLLPTLILSGLTLLTESIKFTDTLCPPHPRVKSLIANFKPAAKAFMTSQLGLLTNLNPTSVLLFTDESLIPTVGTGVAAFHAPIATFHPAKLGDLYGMPERPL